MPASRLALNLEEPIQGLLFDEALSDPGVRTAEAERGQGFLLVPDEALAFEESPRRAYRPHNFQSFEGPRLYQSNGQSVQNVVAATQVAMGAEMTGLRQAVLGQLTALMRGSLAMPDDIGIRAVGTHCDFGAESPQRTAEASLVLGLGPWWENRETEIFRLAAKVSATLGGRPVAVFIPSEDGEAYHLQINLANGMRPTPGAMDEAISGIQEAYTLHLDEVGWVKAIDVVGTMVEMADLIEAAEGFDKHCKITVETGTAYLVTEDGKKIEI